MRTELKTFSSVFVGSVGDLVKMHREAGKGMGLTDDEVNAVISETFQLLGRKAKLFRDKAKIK